MRMRNVKLVCFVTSLHQNRKLVLFNLVIRELRVDYRLVRLCTNPQSIGFALIEG